MLSKNLAVGTRIVIHETTEVFNVGFFSAGDVMTIVETGTGGEYPEYYAVFAEGCRSVCAYGNDGNSDSEDEPLQIFDHEWRDEDGSGNGEVCRSLFDVLGPVNIRSECLRMDSVMVSSFASEEDAGIALLGDSHQLTAQEADAVLSGARVDVGDVTYFLVDVK